MPTNTLIPESDLELYECVNYVPEVVAEPATGEKIDAAQRHTVQAAEPKAKFVA